MPAADNPVLNMEVLIKVQDYSIPPLPPDRVGEKYIDKTINLTLLRRRVVARKRIYKDT
jgi:hypothetical protein